MISDTMTFRRRSIAERKALRLVRGETSAAEYEALHESEAHPASADANLGEYRRAHFGCLREFARCNAVAILPLDASFVTSGELKILRWLAEAQRRTGLRTCYFRDLGLRISLRHCADMLKRLGVWLPPRTLHIQIELDDDPPLPNKASYRAACHENTYGKGHFVMRIATYRRSERT